MDNETLFDKLHRIHIALGEAEIDLREKRDEMNMVQTRILCDALYPDGPKAWRDIWDSNEWKKIYSEVGTAERKVYRLRADLDDMHHRLYAAENSGFRPQDKTYLQTEN